MPLTVAQLVTSPLAFQENAYVLTDPERRLCAVCDPGDGAAKELLRLRDQDGYTLTHVLLTHAHLDHAWDLGAIREAFPDAGVVMHEDERYNVEAFSEHARLFGFSLDPLPPIPDDEIVQEGDTVRIGDTELLVIHTPGHTLGHVIYYWGAGRPRIDPETNTVHCDDPDAAGDALVGDLVMMRSVGRTDLPGGDVGQLKHSILEKLFRLPGPTRLYSGHGSPSTVAEEVEHNQFLGRRARESGGLGLLGL